MKMSKTVHAFFCLKIYTTYELFKKIRFKIIFRDHFSQRRRQPNPVDDTIPIQCFHYNGHDVPRPTQQGEIWVFNHNVRYLKLNWFK